MEVVIRINIDGAAFKPEPEPEVNRILDYVGTRCLCFLGTNLTLRDINGNVCGSVSVEE